MLAVGTVLAGRYRLVERLGAGGMGVVWRATHEVLGRPVAVKVLNPELLADPVAARRFRAEARNMATVEHPGVAAVYDFLDDDAGALLVMEFVAGEPLSTVLSRERRLSPERTMELMAQTAEALHAAHEREIVHRDVKPSNLLVRPGGEVVLIDFGIARMREGTRWTATGAILGTLLYLSPEQVLGQPVTAATDVYALGLVAHVCLTGRDAFDREGMWATAMARVHEAPPTLPTDVPPPVAKVLAQALARDPADRWPSAADLAIACRAATTRPPPAAPPPAELPEGPPARSGTTRVFRDSHADTPEAEPPAQAARPTVPVGWLRLGWFYVAPWLAGIWQVLIASTLLVETIDQDEGTSLGNAIAVPVGAIAFLLRWWVTRRVRRSYRDPRGRVHEPGLRLVVYGLLGVGSILIVIASVVFGG